MEIVQNLSEMFLNDPNTEIWVAPVFKHIFSSKSDLLDFGTRLEMAKLAFAGMKNVVVSDIEQNIKEGNPHVMVGTIDILHALCKKYPELDVRLVLGADTLNDLLQGKWKNSAAVFTTCTRIYALSRDDVMPNLSPKITHDLSSEARVGLEEIAAAAQVPGKIEILEFEFSPDARSASSTAVRKDKESRYVTDAVLQYMQEKGLYGFELPDSSQAAVLRNKNRLSS